MSKRIELKDAKEGQWVEFDLLEDVNEGDFTAKAGHYEGKLRIPGNTEVNLLAALAGATVFAIDACVLDPNMGEGVGTFGLFHVYRDDRTHVQDNIDNLRVYDEPPTDDTIPNPTTVTITRLEDVRPGDIISIGTVEETHTGSVNGIVKKIVKADFSTRDTWIVYVAGFHMPYLVGEGELELRSCIRTVNPEPGLPTETGFYKDAEGGWWAYDATTRLSVRFRDKNGDPMVGGSPVYGRDRLKREARERHLLPFQPFNLEEVGQ